MTFANKTFLITGASDGIGRSLAIKLAEKGANLVLAARNESGLAETANACIHGGGKAIPIPTDVTNQEACQNFIEKAIKNFGAIDGLVNNAGIGMFAKFEEVTDLSIFDRMMKVNYLGAVYCTHYALPYLKQSKGLLVAISSLTGKYGIPTRSGYAASKHAMQGFFDCLRIELRGTGVDVLVVSPGFVATEIRHKLLGIDGKIIKATLSNEQENMMSVSECVEQIVKAMEKRQRELIMTRRGRFGIWLKLIAPNFLDRIAEKAISSQKER